MYPRLLINFLKSIPAAVVGWPPTDSCELLFNNINKLKGPPKEFPKELHWFKWEAYTTWISGFVLLIIIYYLNAEGMMIDKNVNDITPLTAIIISIIFLIGSWFLYDLLCKSKLISAFCKLNLVKFNLLLFDKL